MKLRTALLSVAMTMTALSAHAMLPTTEGADTATTSQATQRIDVKLNAFLVRKDAAGNETLQPVNVGDKVARGEIVEYQTLYTNQDLNRVRSMVATVSIPDGVELVGDVAPRIVKASADGNRFVNMPIRVNVNGQVQELPLNQYKALRWTIEDLGIGGTAVVKYRAVIK